RRAQQQEDWMWAMIDAHLSDAVRESPGVRAIRAETEAAVRAGTLSAVDGSTRILAALTEDLRAR
ncbi:MAG: methylmalonyl Co-A mutase-associated GTPase MeaB, partial [Actinomycetia bacterium]|nr:methylmalonyl Co-A mutase-associated GTPase MeaB [Actinomycetes bacterium]